jgi:hypothetical protein
MRLGSLSGLAVVLSFVLAVLVPAQPTHAQDPDVSARFLDVGDTRAGRIHLSMRFQSPDDGHTLRIQDVTGDSTGIDIRVRLEREPDDVFGPEVQVTRQSLTIDGLPPGRYPLRLVDLDVGEVTDQVEIEVAETVQLPHPLPARIWPSDAGRFDRLWLIFEPASFCDRFSIGNAFLESQRIAIFREPVPCTDTVTQPRLVSIPLPDAEGPLSGVRQLEIIDEGQPGNDRAKVGTLWLDIADRLSWRLGGHWFNPEQSGHGIDLQMLDDGQLLLTWFVFDQAGNPAWLVATGGQSGTTAILDAVIVEGGRFPPAFDAEAVVRHPWGRIELEFLDCSSAIMRWSSDFPGFNDGELSVQRLTSTAGHSCDQPPPDSALVPDWYRGPGSYFRLP